MMSGVIWFERFDFAGMHSIRDGRPVNVTDLLWLDLCSQGDGWM